MKNPKITDQTEPIGKKVDQFLIQTQELDIKHENDYMTDGELRRYKFIERLKDKEKKREMIKNTPQFPKDSQNYIKPNPKVKSRFMKFNFSNIGRNQHFSKINLLDRKHEIDVTTPTNLTRIIDEDDKRDNIPNIFTSASKNPYCSEEIFNIKKKFIKDLADQLQNQKKLYIKKSDLFQRDILRVAYLNTKRRRPHIDEVVLSERESNFDIYEKVNILKYRESVFKAASKLTRKIPPFPRWSYKNRPGGTRNIIKINVSGTFFETFDETLMNLPHTKLTANYLYNSSDSILYFDRDPGCFNAVLNFYRTGKLHAPAFSCLSFFEEELHFWGINEDLMEPCCYTNYMDNKNISASLQKYMESMKKPKFPRKSNSVFYEAQQKCNLLSISEVSGMFGRFYSLIYATAILTTIIVMTFGTNSLGRIDIATRKISMKYNNESLLDFFSRTKINPILSTADILLNGFFLVDFLARFILSSNRLLFFSDMFNWCDLMVIISSILSDLPMIKHSEKYEVYPLLLKVPRIFRIFRLTKTLRFGLDAFILTLRASTSEMLLILVITMIFACFYGVLIYVVELTNESKDNVSSFKSVFVGMWWAIVTMATVGYGDFVPQSSYGYLVGYICILTGIIITQLPVPIFLKSFSVFYNQIEARMKLENTVLNSNVDPESLKLKESRIKDLNKSLNK